ncbi:transmembrane protein 237-like isoform X2 [Chiloscyllium plagiosum]|uniref:transmembrane protein 237-like isoform X2 n=1 Tax=Chiloscyllium plagiosum TaxID=36176 RepID=UPI001CB8424E|nr:transmembrane protein 237-like isoform X2 [Chiloscyllium plagiosum]
MDKRWEARPPRTLPPVPSKAKDVSINKTRKKKSSASNGVDTLVTSTGRRHSESIEPLTPDLQDTAPKKKKKKKKLSAETELETSFTQQNASDVCNFYTGPDDEVSRKIKKRTKRTRPAGYSNELEVEEEDIIGEGQVPRPQGPIFAISAGSSQPVDKVFLERSRRFQATDRLEIQKSAEQVDVYMEVKPTLTTRDVSLQVHRGFRIIGLFSQGFLSGYMVWNIIVVYALSGNNFSELPNLLQQYSMLVYPGQCLLYMLLAISTVSAFDRVNLADAAMAVRRIVTLDPAALASVLYFIALVLSLSQQMPSDRLNRHRFTKESNFTLWPSGSEFQILHPWVVVNLVVSILVGLAWIFLSYHPTLDYTEESEFASHMNDIGAPDEKIKAQA